MSNKVNIALFAVLFLLVGFLTYQFFQLQKNVDDLAIKLTESVNITPAVNNTSAAETSPFDKANVDPMANQFPPNSASLPLTEIKFDRMVHDFGKINEGDKVNTVFKFKNSGKNPLIISNATGSCGCTVPNWPKAAIEPGSWGEIAVEFDSNRKSGEQSKTVTVKANTTPPSMELTIKSTVIPKDK
jgi:hypothetical protein